MDFNFKEYEVRDEKTNKSTLMMSRVLFSNDTTFGNYDLAERLIKVEYTKKSESRKVRELQDSNNEINLNCCYNCFYSKEETKEDLLARNHLKVLNEKRNKNKI